MRFYSIIGLIIAVSGCTVLDKPVNVVSNFNINKYEGSWYEVARLDHSFEQNLTHVTAQYYTQNKWVKVINRGYNSQTKEWQQAIGKAKFIDSPSQGLLKVSFFGPFYGAYQIHALKKNTNNEYIASLVIGPNSEYAWILSREKTLPENIKLDFVKKMNKLGIKTENLIWVSQKDDVVFGLK